MWQLNIVLNLQLNDEQILEEKITKFFAIKKGKKKFFSLAEAV